MRALPTALAQLLRGCSAALLAACLVAAAPAPSWAADSGAESTAQALSLGKQGAAAYEAGNHAQAITHFERAFELLPAPSLQLWAARSCAKLGRLVEAQQRYRQALAASAQVGDPAVQLDAQRAAKQELEQLAEQTPLLGVRVVGTAGQPARLTLDEQPFASEPGQLTPVDPGHHVLVGSYRGQHVSLSVDLAEGERRELVLELSPAASGEQLPARADPARPPARAPAMTAGSSAKAWQTAGWIGIGAGGALLLTGIVTRSVAQERYDTLQRQPGCSRTQCAAAERDSVDRYHSMRTVSLVTSIGGLVVAAAGAGAVLLSPGDEEGGLALLPGGLLPSGVLPSGLAWSGRF